MKTLRLRPSAISLLLASASLAAALEIPAFTAYTLPSPDTLRISERDGITRWTQPDTSEHWYGGFSQGSHRHYQSARHVLNGLWIPSSPLHGHRKRLFLLSHGGFIEGFTEYGTRFDRPASGLAPADLNLPPLPEQVRDSPARAMIPVFGVA